MPRKIQYTVIAATAAALLFGAATCARAEEEDAGVLVKAVLDALPKVPFTSKMTLTTPQGNRKIGLSSKRVGDARASYLEVVAPESLQGIRFLFIEKYGAAPEQYVKVASSRNAVRVADQVRRQPFLESAFYVSDMVEPDLSAYTYRFVGGDEIGGRSCRLVEMTAKKPEAEVYSKTVLALDPKDLLVMRRQFFDKKGELQKVWTVRKVEKVDGIWTMMLHEMDNVAEKVTSRLEINDIKYNVELSDSMFTPKYLLR
jgi:outer membrane lipoprotein-sorting protein